MYLKKQQHGQPRQPHRSHLCKGFLIQFVAFVELHRTCGQPKGNNVGRHEDSWNGVPGESPPRQPFGVQYPCWEGCCWDFCLKKHERSHSRCHKHSKSASKLVDEGRGITQISLKYLFTSIYNHLYLLCSLLSKSLMLRFQPPKNHNNSRARCHNAGVAGSFAKKNGAWRGDRWWTANETPGGSTLVGGFNPLKNISQNGNSSPSRGENKNIWNH